MCTPNYLHTQNCHLFAKSLEGYSHWCKMDNTTSFLKVNLKFICLPTEGSEFMSQEQRPYRETKHLLGLDSKSRKPFASLLFGFCFAEVPGMLVSFCNTNLSEDAEDPWQPFKTNDLCCSVWSLVRNFYWDIVLEETASAFSSSGKTKLSRESSSMLASIAKNS